MKKIRIPVLLLCLTALLPAGCAREARVNLPTFAARLRAADPAAGFREEEAFYAEGSYYVYYSLSSPHDTLLELREDADRTLDRVALTAAAPADPAAFVRLCEILAAQFVPTGDPAALPAAAGVTADGLYEDALRRAAAGRYTAVFSASPLGACFFIERN